MDTADEDRLYEALDDATCRQLLGTARTGRLGFTDGALPAILPVPFALRDEHVIIPARQGSSVVSAVRGAVVAVQVDSYDAVTRTGWSVTVLGPTRLLSLAEDVSGLEELEFASLPPAAQRCYIAVRLGLVRGWRMTECPESSAPVDRAAVVGPLSR